MAFENFILNFDYKQQGTAETFNLINHKLQPNGVYEGFDITKVDDVTVTVGTGICYIEGSTNALSCRAELTSSDNLTVSSATPYIVLRFTWVNTETNIPSVLAVEYSSINSTDLIIGECIYDGTTLIEINTNLKEISSVQDLENNKDAFHVYSTQPISKDISIKGGSAIINGKLVTITDTTFEVTNNTTSGRNDVIYLDDSGTINILEGTDAGSPTTPTYPSNSMVLCEVQRGASRDNVKNNEIVQIANKKDIIYGETVVTNIDKNFVGVIQAINAGKLNSSNEPDYLSESSGTITLLGSTTSFRCNIGDGYSDFGKQAYRLNIKDDSNTIDLSGESDDDYYIILDYNTSTGATSLEAITVPRIMSTIEPSHATDQLWYNINDNKIYESDGSTTWTQTHKLVLGMVNKSGTTYTIYNRAFNDYYYDEFTVAINNRYLKSHNIFTENINIQLYHYDSNGNTGWIRNYINRDDSGVGTRKNGASLVILERTIDVRYNEVAILEGLSSPSGYTGSFIYETGTAITSTEAKLIAKRSF